MWDLTQTCTHTQITQTYTHTHTNHTDNHTPTYTQITQTHRQVLRDIVQLPIFIRDMNKGSFHVFIAFFNNYLSHRIIDSFRVL